MARAPTFFAEPSSTDEAQYSPEVGAAVRAMAESWPMVRGEPVEDLGQAMADPIFAAAAQHALQVVAKESVAQRINAARSIDAREEEKIAARAAAESTEVHPLIDTAYVPGGGKPRPYERAFELLIRCAPSRQFVKEFGTVEWDSMRSMVNAILLIAAITSRQRPPDGYLRTCRKRAGIENKNAHPAAVWRLLLAEGVEIVANAPAHRAFRKRPDAWIAAYLRALAAVGVTGDDVILDDADVINNHDTE